MCGFGDRGRGDGAVTAICGLVPTSVIGAQGLMTAGGPMSLTMLSCTATISC